MNEERDKPCAPVLPESRAKMAVPSDAPPGVELDEEGELIPFSQRTREDREKAAGKPPTDG